MLEFTLRHVQGTAGRRVLQDRLPSLLTGRIVQFGYMKAGGERSRRHGEVDKVTDSLITIADATRGGAYRSFRLDGIEKFEIVLVD